MKLIPLFLLVGMLAVSGWAEEYNLEPYSPELVKKAEAGDAEAQYNQGQCHEKGLGVIKDNKEAVKWYTKSAEQGYTKAAFALSRCYKDGKGVLRDKNLANKWFVKGVDNSDEKQLFEILKSIDPSNSRDNTEERLLLFRRLAELGNAEGQYECGWSYEYGESIAEDKKEAMKWYMKAAEQGNVKAQIQLGNHYNNSSDDKEETKKEAFKWYMKAAEQGDRFAQYSIGEYYERGFGVLIDEQEAVKWYTKAAEQGSSYAKKALKRFKSK
jgi:TPR repeat protein